MRAKGGRIEGGNMRLERLSQYVEENGRVSCRYRFIPEQEPADLAGHDYAFPVRVMLGVACPHADFVDATTYGDLPNRVKMCVVCGESFTITPDDGA